MQTFLPPLPAAFSDCEALVFPRAQAGPDAVPLTEIFTPQALQRGFAGITGRWGPGDSRAAVSLWSQGYFSRLLRPWLAYGVIHGIWIAPQPERISVQLSPLSTPARFGVETDACNVATAFETLLGQHLRPLIALLSSGTGTSSRLHWGNAAFPLHRILRQIAAAAADDGTPEMHERLAEAQRMLTLDQPFGLKVRLLPQPEAEPVLQRRICCMRYLLDGLAKCKSACPIADM